MWNELKRKFFHLFSLVYIVGLVFIPRPRYLVILFSLLIFIFVMETLRLRVSAFKTVIEKTFRPIMRTKEETRYSGLFWMLFGVFLTILLIDPIPVAATALLYLILGDAMAALVGLRLKGPLWPGSKKSILGSLACFLTCGIVGYVLLRPDFAWSGIFLGALTATVVEMAVVPIDDNITIPVASGLVLMLCYGLTPGFLTFL